MNRPARVATAIVAVGLHFVVLYASQAPAAPSGGLPMDKVAHIAVFALPTAALLAAGVPRAWAIGLMALHAPLSELIQHSLLQDRSGDAGDTLADLAGVALGAMLIRPARGSIGPQVSSASATESHPG